MPQNRKKVKQKNKINIVFDRNKIKKEINNEITDELNAEIYDADTLNKGILNQVQDQGILNQTQDLNYHYVYF